MGVTNVNRSDLFNLSRMMDKQKNENGADTREGKSRQPFWWQAHPPACLVALPERGKLCPECGRAPLDYNDQFILACPQCGYVAEAGAFT